MSEDTKQQTERHDNRDHMILREVDLDVPKEYPAREYAQQELLYFWEMGKQIAGHSPFYTEGGIDQVASNLGIPVEQAYLAYEFAKHYTKGDVVALGQCQVIVRWDDIKWLWGAPAEIVLSIAQKSRNRNVLTNKLRPLGDLVAPDIHNGMIDNCVNQLDAARDQNDADAGMREMKYLQRLTSMLM